MTAYSAPTNIKISDSVSCGSGVNNTSAPSGVVGLDIGAGVRDFSLQNSRIGGNCDVTIAGNMDYSIKFGGANHSMIVTGNNLYNWHYGPFTPTTNTVEQPFANNNESNIINNNLGIDDQVGNYTAQANMDFGVYNTVSVNGATPMATIAGCWNGRKITIVPAVGGIAWTGAGTIAQNTIDFSGTAGTGQNVWPVASGSNPCSWTLR